MVRYLEKQPLWAVLWNSISELIETTESISATYAIRPMAKIGPP